MTTDPSGNESSNPAFDRNVYLLRRVAAAWCVLVGFAVLVVGWGFGVNALKAVPPGAPYMRVNTAIGLLILGSGLWAKPRWRHFAATAGGLVALIGVLTVIEYACGVNLHIDELAMRDSMPPVPGWPHGRMALTIAVCFSLLGSGLALSASRRALFTIQWLAIPAAGLSVAGMIDNLYGLAPVFGLAPYMYIPAHAALTLFIVSIALLFAHPRQGVIRNITSSGPGGVMVRRLMPAAILVPSLLGWLRWQGRRMGYYDTAFDMPLFVSASAVVFTALTWVSARMLDRSDEHRKEATRELRASEKNFRLLSESTPDAMIITDQNGQIILVNTQAEALFGYAREEILGEPIDKLVPDAARDGAAGPLMCSEKMDIRGLRKDGGEFFAGVTLNSIQTRGGARVVCAVRDQTAQKMAESALRESEARFRQLADAMPQIVWTAGPDGDVDYHNRRWCDYTGGTPEMSRDLGWQPVLHPYDLANCVERRTLAIAAGEAYEVEYRLRRAADGAYRWHLGRALPVHNPEGGIIRWFGTCTDVDDQKRAEQEVREACLRIQNLNDTLEQSVRERTLQLRQSQELFRNLVEGVKEYSILTLDPQGCFTSWTNAAERLEGYSSTEILGKSFSCFYTPGDIKRGHPAEVLAAATLNGRFEEQGWRVRKDGTKFWAEVLITAMRDETGRLQGFSKITRDITERKENDEKTRQSEEQFRALLESAPDAVVIADKEGAIVLVNAQAERMFGYQRQEMVRQPVEMLLPRGARTVQAQQGESDVESASVRRMGIGLELSGIRKTGEEFAVEVSLSPIETAQGSWVAAAVRDIGERKSVERLLVIARQRAEEANRAKSAFLAAMSHEIRTPMNAILGMSDLLSETELNDAQRQYVQVFRRAGSNLLYLINNILDFSKIEAGHFDLEQTEFQLRELLDQTIELVAPKTKAKGLALVLRLNPNVANRFTGDANRLRQVLINLLGNAIKFTEAGEVAVTVQEPEAGPAGHLEFLVSDTGIGIPQEQLEAIFEDFKQGDSSTTRKYGGSGLGLAISRRIVERMGGTLSVTTVLGKGSTFRFSVPLQPAPERPEEQVAAVHDFHGQHVAVIDSNTTNCLILRETLGGWGIETTEFSSCENALAALTQMPPAACAYALIIIDRQVDSRVDGGRFPANGFETATQIRAVFQDLPLIMLSNDDRPGDDVRCREIGCLGYAVRPVSPAVLLQLVSTALGGTPTEVAGSPRQPVPGSSKGTAHTKSLRILIAEDSPDNRLLVQLYLEGSPHTLTFVNHGGEAVEAVASKEFDIVLMDVQMPVMDGLTATSTIRAMEVAKSGRSVPILALSANARPEDVESSLAAGCNAHLSKPISKHRLLEALDGYSKTPPAADFLH
jgi:PAS domain S-box-containing protein